MTREAEDLSRRMREFTREREKPEYVTALDSWSNSQTGIGTSRDKVTATGFSTDGQLAFGLLEDLYHNDDVAARVCDLMPEQAFREGYSIPDTKLQSDMEELGVCDAFEQAWVFSRLYGGSAVLMGMPGANPKRPVKTGDVTSLTVLDRYMFSVWKYYEDITSPKYGLPEIYQVRRPFSSAAGNKGVDDGGQLIHETRLITFPGARTSPRRKVANQHWDDSVLQRCYSVVQAYGLTWASVIHLLQDAAQGVYSMKELWNMIVGGNKSMVEERMKLVDEQRSSARMILVDADNEKFERVPTPFQSIPELIDRISERLASAAGTPLTILMGSSPAGMNATGKSDLEIWYGRVGAGQRKVVAPRLAQLAKVMGAKKPDQYSAKFPPLFVPTIKEQAETRYMLAQADNLWQTMGSLLPQEIRNSRFKPTGFGVDVQIDPKAKTHIPTPAAAPGAAGKAADPNAPGSAAGTRHYSPKYAR